MPAAGRPPAGHELPRARYVPSSWRMSTSTVPAIVAAGRPAAGRSTVRRATGAATPDTIVTAVGRVSAVSQADSGAAAGAFAQTHVRIRYVGPSARRSGVDVAVAVAVASV